MTVNCAGCVVFNVAVRKIGIAAKTSHSRNVRTLVSSARRLKEAGASYTIYYCGGDVSEVLT